MYNHFELNIKNHIAHVAFNRPNKANSLDMDAWKEMKAIFESIHENDQVRVAVLSGNGKHFCAGIDLTLLMDIQKHQSINCEARKREKLRAFILELQACISSIEKCRKPVLAAIHKGCIGGGVDIVSACDMRYCTQDAYFTIKEVDMGLVADIGTMQRLPKIIPPGMMAEMAYTGRKVYGEEAVKINLANQCYTDKDAMLEAVMEIAQTIASKSPVVIRGTKEILLHSRDHTVAEGLDYIATWNAGMLISNDLQEAFLATMEKRSAVFE